MSNIIFLKGETARRRRPVTSKQPMELFEKRRRKVKMQVSESEGRPERKVAHCGVVVGKNIQRLLDREGVSQSELARKLGTQPSVINEICNGKRNISLSRLDKIRSALGVDCYEFMMPPVKPE